MKNTEKRNQIIAMLYQNMDKVDADETLKLIDDYKPTEAVKNNAVLPHVSVAVAVEEILKPKYMNDVYTWKQVQDAINKATER